MAEPIGRAAWQELINLLVVQRRRLAEYDDLYEPLTLPKPGATEVQLAAAEARLGHPLDPHYREFLSVANGWDEYFISLNLLGAEDIAAGRRWQHSRETIETFMDGSGGNFAAGLGVPDDHANCQPIGNNDDGYNDHLYLFVRDAPGCRAGSVFALHVDTETIWPDLHTYLSVQLSEITTFADQAALGPHAEPWGRDIRRNPPSMADIVDRLVDLATLAAKRHPSPTRSAQRPYVRAGANATALDSLDADLGGTLHPEHRELLAITDGIADESRFIGNVLSVEQIRDGALWREGITQAQQLLDNYPDPKEPVLQRISAIPAVPFAVNGPQLYGVDIRDGHVRNLVDDATITGPHEAHTRSAGTVREHLLTECDRLWWNAGCPR